MKNATAITIFFLLPFLVKAQVDLKTIVPSQPVVAGESFQVQYVFPVTRVINFKAPSFRSFRFVSGPNQYTGSVNTINGTMPVTNFVFTLEAVKPGRFIIPGASATINGRVVKSNDAIIEVISQQRAQRLADNSFITSDYILRAGEDPYEKIRQNLFLKVLVDRSQCFAGEPILATFKLYSRLQSRSDIIKNPGFYGFTVHDMVNLADKEMLTEEINGKLFDVHTIRKVQLFPLHEGVFIIDAMEVMNKVEFSRSIVNRKAEQEIAEGVLDNDETATNENAEVYETRISTQPVLIRVKPLPNKPPDFDGAVGHFSISSSLLKNKIARNEEGVFEIVIRGQGNFTQINAPVVNWPAGIEGFEPVIVDSIDKTQLPLKGSRSFRYSFTGARPGKYSIPATSFTYFDPQGKYRTDSSAPLLLEVSSEEKIYSVIEKKKGSITATNASASRIAMIIVISLVVLVMIYLIRDKKEPAGVKEEKQILPGIEELLGPAYAAIDRSDREFYSTLRQCTWDFFNTHFQFSGSDMNKETLIAKLRSMHVDQEYREEIGSILQKCEEGMFTQAELAENKLELIKKTEIVLKKISDRLVK
jgi:hypothetical protein